MWLICLGIAMALPGRAFVLHLSRAACVELLLYKTVFICSSYVLPTYQRALDVNCLKNFKVPAKAPKVRMYKRHHHTIYTKRLTPKHFLTVRTKIKNWKVTVLPRPCQNNTSKHTRSLKPIQQTYSLSLPLPHNSSPHLARRRSESTRQALEAPSTQKTPLRRILSRRCRFWKRRILSAATMSALRAKAAFLQAWASKAM